MQSGQEGFMDVLRNLKGKEKIMGKEEEGGLCLYFGELHVPSFYKNVLNNPKPCGCSSENKKRLVPHYAKIWSEFEDCNMNLTFHTATLLGKRDCYSFITLRFKFPYF